MIFNFGFDVTVIKNCLRLIKNHWKSLFKYANLYSVNFKPFQTKAFSFWQTFFHVQSQNHWCNSHIALDAKKINTRLIFYRTAFVCLQFANIKMEEVCMLVGSNMNTLRTCWPRIFIKEEISCWNITQGGPEIPDGFQNGAIFDT